MSGLQPVSMYSMRIPPGDFMLPAVPDHAAMLRVTMAAVDPTEEPDFQDVEEKTERATLKIVRVPDELLDDDSDSEDDEDYSDLDDEEIDSDEADGINGEPSGLKLPKKSKKQALLDALAADEAEDDDMDSQEDSEDGEEAAEAIAKLKAAMKGSKGKEKAVNGEIEEDDDDEDMDDTDSETVGLEETVICTLDTKTHYQQPLDLVIGEGERIFFKVSGTHTIHLTGNFVIPEDDGSASLYDDPYGDDYDDEDESMDEELLDPSNMLDGSESDELDELEDPRITEVSDDQEAPKLLEAKKEKAKGKGKNKRPAEDSADDSDEPALDDIMSKALKKEDIAAAAAAAGAPTTNGEAPKKLSKAEKKRQKKLKNNDGEATAAPVAETTTKKEPLTNGANGTNGSEKKVQFAKNLEQGPTPSGNTPKSSQTSTADSTKKTSSNIKTVQGVTVDERKTGSGPGAKKNNKVELRYIGKLEDGKVFDSNKSGTPFSFKMGKGEVIRGMEVGLEGISAGGERRLTIPAKMGYASKGMPGIPKNSTLIFDIKCLAVK